MDKIIELKDVVYEYKSMIDDSLNRALDNISLSVKRGEFLVILGHNGSGKSTIAKLVNGLILPTSGDVTVQGLNTNNDENIWEIREKVGMVFQNPDNQMVATIVEEDVAFGPENIGIEPLEIRKRVDDALEKVEMSDYKRHAPHLLSGGQKQRVAIAGILAMNPDCIILDEPTAMLDPIGRKEVLDTVQKLNKEEGKTIILITHYMNEAVDADRILVIENGKVIMEGNPKEVFSQVEKVKQIGLDVPQVTELVYLLNKDGYKYDSEILTVDELVNAI